MRIPCIALIIAATTIPVASRANDSALAFGGSPRALSEHPTVSMKSEVVTMKVGEEKVTVDCSFVFENHGPTCKVRMGFPDQGQGAANPDEEGEHNPPKGTFSSFESWVDGKAVKTKLIRAAHPGNFWHFKVVTFPANNRVSIRDRYTVSVGLSSAYGFLLHQTTYILHTGASWHRNIGRSEIIVHFQSTGVRAPIELKKLTWLPKKRADDFDRPNYWNDHSGNKHRVYYSGPCKPDVSHKTLRFVKSNWRPREKDDVELVFEMARPQG